MGEPATCISVDNSELKNNRKRFLLLGPIRKDQEKYLFLKLKDEQHTWHNIPLGKVTPSSEGTYNKENNILVPVVPYVFTTPEHKKTEYKRIPTGWLYIFKDGYLWRELEVLVNGKMKDVNLTYWQGQNKRKATGEVDNRVVVPHKIGSKKCKIEMAFSHIQWSWEYICKLGGMSEKNDTRYKKDQHNGSAYGRDYSKISKSDDLYMKRVDLVDLKSYANNYDTPSACGNKQALVVNVNKLEGLPKNRLEVKLHVKGEYAAAVIDDPVGIANSLANKLEEGWYQMETTLASLRTGEKPLTVEQARRIYASLDPKKIEEKIKASKLSEKEIKFREKVGAQFDIASLIYQIAYGSEDNKDTYGDDLNKDRVRLALGFTERKKIRKEIKKNSEKLVKYLKTDDYEYALNDYGVNEKEEIIIGKACILFHQRRLSFAPYSKDRHLELKEDIKDEVGVDKGNEYLLLVLEKKNNAGNLLWQTVKDVHDADMIGKWGDAVTNFVDTYSLLAKSEVKYLKLVEGVINSIESPKLSVWSVREVTYKSISIPKGFKQVEGAYRKEIIKHVGMKTSTNATQAPGRQSGFTKIRIVDVNININKAGDITESLYEYRIFQLVEKQNNSVKMMRDWQSSPWYKKKLLGFLGLVEVINMGSAVKQVSETYHKKNASKADIAKHTINVVEAAVGAGDFLAASVVLHAKLKGNTIILVRAEFMARILGSSAWVLTGVMSGIDSAVNFMEKDFDAAFAYLGSAVVAVGIGIAIAMEASGFLIVPGIFLFIGLYIYANFLEDDPIEKYAKNGQFQKNAKLPAGSDLWDKIKRMAKNPITSGGLTEYKNLIKSRELLYDLVFGYGAKITIKHTKAYKEVSNVLVRHSKVDDLEVTVKSRMFFRYISELEYKLRIYPKGISDNFIEVAHTNIDYVINKESKQVETIVLYYKFSDSVMKAMKVNAELLFFSRINPNIRGGNYVPSSYGGTEFRYTATAKNAVRTFYPLSSAASQGYSGFVDEDNMTYGKSTRVGTIKELQNPKIWKRKF